MHILCERTGGFAGLTTRVEIDSAKLTVAQNRELQTLVEQARLFDQPVPKKSKTLADGFQYDLTVTDEDSERALRFDEGSLSEEMAALLDWLMAYRSKKQK